MALWQKPQVENSPSSSKSRNCPQINLPSSSTLFLFVLCKCDHNLPHLAEGTPQALVFWGVCGALWACDSRASGHSSWRRGQQTQALGSTGVQQRDSPSTNLQTVMPSCIFNTRLRKNETYDISCDLKY